MTVVLVSSWVVEYLYVLELFLGLGSHLVMKLFCQNGNAGTPKEAFIFIKLYIYLSAYPKYLP